MRIRILVTAVTLSGCGLNPPAGHLNDWTANNLAPVGDTASVRVYDFGYDAGNDRLTLSTQLPASDTIGVITYELEEKMFCNPSCTDYEEVRRRSWHYEPERVARIKERAWKKGGSAILLASPKIERQGVWRLVSDAAGRESISGNEEAARRLRSMVGSTWLIYAAWVIRESE